MTQTETYMELIQNYADETRNAVQEARIAGTETKISQKLGKMMIRHALVLPMVPEYLDGCVDAIYAEGLQQLYNIAYESDAKGESIDSDLMISIFDVLNGLQERMAGKIKKENEA